MPEFRPKKILPKAKEWIIKRLTDPGNPYTKPKPVIEIGEIGGKSFSAVMDQKMFAGRVVLKRLRTNPYNKFRVAGQTKKDARELINLAESTKPTKIHAKLIRAINKPKYSILRELSNRTGLPSLEKKSIQAGELATKAGSSRKALETFTGTVNKAKETKRQVNKAIENPGRAVTKAAEVTVRNPEITIGGVAGKGIMLVPGVPMSVKMAPIGNASLAVAAGRKALFPGATKALEKTADAIHNSPRRPAIERGINTLVKTGINVAKSIPV